MKKVYLLLLSLVVIMIALTGCGKDTDSAKDNSKPISDSPAVIMIMINLFMILLGMLMDDTSGVLLATPILLPIVTELGVSPIQFAAIVGVNLGMGNITPPTAPLLYLGGKISGAEVKEMLPHTMRLILFAWLPTLIITTYVPDLSLFLPRLFGYC